MRFENPTDLDARLFRGEIRADEMLATLVVKTVHDIDPRGRLGEPLPGALVPSPIDTPTALGVVPGDRVPYRRGVDVWVLGHARPAHATAAMTVELAVGDQTRALLVVGDRHWRRDGTASAPAPFTEMPLSYARAYGGRVVDGEGEHVHALNPDGRGFVTNTRQITGVALPNVEWPDDRVRSWSCRPEVAGLAALGSTSPMQLARAVRPDPAAAMGFRLTSRWFSCAHDRLVFARADPGMPVRLAGMGNEGRVRFELPRVRLHADVTLGSRRDGLALRLDTIGVLADRDQVVLSYRASFRYSLVKHQQRRATLRREDEV